MKNLHYYIQCVLILLALSIAVQIPFQENLIGYVVMIEFLLGAYQLGMSVMLRCRLSRKSTLLQVHFFSSIAYLLALIGLGVLSPVWMDELWPFALFAFPWVFAILFLVTIDELERARHYRL